MKKTLKYLFATIGILVVLFLAAAIILPIMYKEKIPVLVKKELDDNLDAVASNEKWPRIRSHLKI